MSSQSICSFCSATIKTRPEWAGRRMRCPHCKHPIVIATTNSAPPIAIDRSPTAASNNWGVIGGVLTLCLVAGAAAGFIFGSEHGISLTLRELNAAKNVADAAIKQQKSLENQLAAMTADIDLEKKRHQLAMQQLETERNVLIKDRDAKLAQARTAEGQLEALAANSRQEAEDQRRIAQDKKKIPAIPMTAQRKQNSEAAAELVNSKLTSTNRSILKGMTMLFGFNSLCDDDAVTKQSAAKVFADDRDLLFTAATMVVDVGNYIPPTSATSLKQRRMRRGVSPSFGFCSA